MADELLETYTEWRRGPTGRELDEFLDSLNSIRFAYWQEKIAWCFWTGNQMVVEGGRWVILVPLTQANWEGDGA